MAVSGCANTGGDAPAPSPTAATLEAFPQTVTDSRGTQLQLGGAPRRIISLSPGVSEVLFAVGAGAQVVATDRFSDYPAEAARTAKLDYSQPSAEAALAHSPDLVIMTTRQESQVEQFRALKLPVLFMEEPKTLAAVVESARLYGRITGHAAEGERLASALQGRIDRIASQVQGAEGPRVFYELSPELYTVSPDSFIGSMISLLGARNVAQGARTAFPQLSAEVVIAADPQVILLADAGSRSGSQNLGTVSARAGWGSVEAVRTRRIYELDPDTVNRPGPRVVDGLEAMARALYPDRFAVTPAAATATGAPR